MNRLLARRPGLLVLVDPSRCDAAEATQLAHQAQTAGAGDAAKLALARAQTPAIVRAALGR